MSHQASRAVLNPANGPSRRFFASVSLKPNMRVLDIGCGNGDLSRLVAELLGPEGEVVAIDRSEDALDLARTMDADPNSAPIRYRQAELVGEFPDLGRFDAIVGRRVLMYLPDAFATLGRLANLAKPGAIIAFQEHSRANLPSGLGQLPVHSQLYNSMWGTVAAEGGDVGLALRLPGLMQAVGFEVDCVRSEGVLLQPGEPSFLPTLAKAMLPRLVQQGVATVEEFELDTLADRIDAERHAVGGTIVWDLAFLVSARAGTIA